MTLESSLSHLGDTAGQPVEPLTLLRPMIALYMRWTLPTYPAHSEDDLSIQHR